MLTDEGAIENVSNMLATNGSGISVVAELLLRQLKFLQMFNSIHFVQQLYGGRYCRNTMLVAVVGNRSHYFPFAIKLRTCSREPTYKYVFRVSVLVSLLFKAADGST
jgi:hypothetical protein